MLVPCQRRQRGVSWSLFKEGEEDLTLVPHRSRRGDECLRWALLELVMQMVANSALQSEKLLAGAVSFSGVRT
jgi:hypothetical protein